MIGVGLELGLMGKGQNLGAETSGLNAMPGGRIIGIIPFKRVFAVKPSIGYFWKTEGTSSIGVTQKMFELGVLTEYIPHPESVFQGRFGLAQKLDVLSSTIYANGVSEGSVASKTRYRVGPNLGLKVKLGDTLDMSTNLEVTFPFGSYSRTHIGMTAGVIYYPWE